MRFGTAGTRPFADVRVRIGAPGACRSASTDSALFVDTKG